MANHRKSAGFVLTWTSPRKSPGQPFVVLSSPPSQIAEAVVVPSSVLAHPPRWLSAAQLHPAPAPLLRDWLFDQGSLTRRLTTLSAERFAVQPLQQGWQVLRADEVVETQRTRTTEERCDDVQYRQSGQTTGGTVIGAIVGAALGNQVGDGDGRKAATVAGAAA